MYNSVIINFIGSILGRLASHYRYSKTSVIVNNTARLLKQWVNGSAIWGFVKSPERTSGYWGNSFCCRAIQWLLDTLPALLKSVPLSLQTAFKTSVTGFAVTWILDRFTVLISLFIVVSAAIPHKYWHNHYATLAVAGMAVLYIFKAAMDRRYRPDLKRLDFTLVLFVLAGVCSALTSINFANSIRTIVLYMVPILLALITATSIKTKDEAGMVVYSIIAITLLTSLYGMWQYINRIPVDPLLVDVTGWKKGVGRVFSTMGNPNNFACFLVLTIPFFGAAYFNMKSTVGKALIAILVLLPVANLALTYTRAAYIGFVVSISVFVFLKNSKYLPSIILMGLASVPLLPQSVLYRIQSLGKDTSSLSRLTIWNYAAKILKDYWVTGIGPGTEAFRRLYGNFPVDFIPVHTHMFPMQLWLEFGVAAFVSFVWFVGRNVKKGLSYIFLRRDGCLRNLMVACISSLAGILTLGMGEYIWFYPRVTMQFWICTGLFLALLKIANAGEGKSYGEKQDNC